MLLQVVDVCSLAVTEYILCNEDDAELSECSFLCDKPKAMKSSYLQACHDIDNNPDLFVLHHEFFICRKVGSDSDPCQAEEQPNDLERYVQIVPPIGAQACQTAAACDDDAGRNEPTPSQT